jgi:hypothetical protein
VTRFSVLVVFFALTAKMRDSLGSQGFALHQQADIFHGHSAAWILMLESCSVSVVVFPMQQRT